MKMWNHYHTPSSVAEATVLLERYAGEARIIAGGTDLLVDMHAEKRKPYKALVDVTSIPELNRIEMNEPWVSIGAGVTHTQITKSPALIDGATCLVESCGLIGGPQVRNVGTLGGNVAHALPAGDGTVSLVALDAEAEIIQQGEQRRVPILEMYRGAGRSLLAPGSDLLLRLHLKVSSEREGSAFQRIMRPQGVALPILGCAVWVRLDESLDNFESVRVCIAPTNPTPQRITVVEDALKGQPTSETTIEQAVASAQESLSLRTSKYRATADYRREMVAVLLRRVIPVAVERAKTGNAVSDRPGI
jgi:CO/xanthine dehydrogenase FAD-binding subunit